MPGLDPAVPPGHLREQLLTTRLEPAPVGETAAQGMEIHEGRVHLEVAQRHQTEPAVDLPAQRLEDERCPAVEMELGPTERPAELPGADAGRESEWTSRS